MTRSTEAMKRTRAMIAAVGTSVTIAALATGCGSSTKNDTTLSIPDAHGAMTTITAANDADRAFVAQMVPHHQMAIEMAKMAGEQGDHAEIRGLSRAIDAAQSEEIKTLTKASERLGVPVASAEGQMEHGHSMESDAKALGLSAEDMGMSMDLAMLDGAEPFDREFIDMMIPHHQGAIRMARAELARGRDAELKEIAEAIVAAQSAEIRRMNAWRKAWYGASSPAGGIPAS